MGELTAQPLAAAEAAPVAGLRLAVTGAVLGRPGRPVLPGLDLSVRPGEILTVVGPSGCGKSTLLRTLAGLLPPLSGQVTADDAPVIGPSADRALVFQEDALLPWRSIRGNVELALAVRGMARAERRAEAERWLERVGLAGRGRDLPQRLSGGQRQRVQLARALAGRPRAVLMDEPFGALDAPTRAQMQLLLVEVLADTRATVVFVTHDVDEALFLGDRVALLGTSGASGPGPQLLGVPHPRDREAASGDATAALRRTVLDALSASSSARS